MVIHETVPYISGNQQEIPVDFPGGREAPGNQQEIPVDFPGGREAPGDSLLVYWRLNFSWQSTFREREARYS